MNTKQLRQKILDLAIRGKLVPQDPNDEHASILLERINAKNKQLLIKGEIPFYIPNSWTWIELRAICEIVTGSTPSKKNKAYYGREYPFYKPADLDKGYDVFSADDMLSAKGFEISRKLPANTVLVTCIGATIGKAGIIRLAGCSNQQINAIITKADMLPEFIYFVCISEFFQEQIRENSSATTLPIINKGNFEKLLFMLPPLKEQHRIVTAIESAFAVIDEIERNKADLQVAITAVKSKILSLAIIGKLVPQDLNDEHAEALLKHINAERDILTKAGKIRKDKPLPLIADEEIPYELPEKWVWCRLGELAHYKKGPFGSSITKAMFVPDCDTAIKVYEQKNAIYKDDSLGDYYISQEKFEELKGFEVLGGDIIVSCAGTIGETYVMPNGIRKGVINQALMKISLFDNSITEFYLMYFDFILKANAQSEAKGTAIKNIPPFDVLKSFFVPLPPLAEQHRIVAAIKAAFEQLDSIAKNLR